MEHKITNTDDQRSFFTCLIKVLCSLRRYSVIHSGFLSLNFTKYELLVLVSTCLWRNIIKLINHIIVSSFVHLRIINFLLVCVCVCVFSLLFSSSK